MIRFARGNLLDSDAEALVNAVNTVGVMGKGIALMFKNAFPDNYRAYRVACNEGKVNVGYMFVYERAAADSPRWIINFPTKKHWRNPSQLEWIREGLQDLRRVAREHKIHSIAIPALGAGLGGLEWDDVRREIERAFSDMDDIDITIYEPQVVR